LKPILLKRRNTTDTVRKTRNTIDTERKITKTERKITKRDITAADSSKSALLPSLLVIFTPSKNSSPPSPLSNLSVPT